MIRDDIIRHNERCWNALIVKMKSVSAVCDALNVSPKTLWRWRNGGDMKAWDFINAKHLMDLNGIPAIYAVPPIGHFDKGVIE